MERRLEKIKILIPIRHPIGGIRTYLKYTYGKLDSNDFDLTLIFPQDYDNDKETMTIVKDLDKYKPTIIVARGRHPLFSIFRQVFSLLRSKNFDLIHSQGTTCGIIACLANIVSKVPHIITLHETFDEGVLGYHLLNLKRRCIGSLLARADIINVVSGDARENLLQMFPELRGKTKRIVVIPNGIDTHYFRETPPDLKRICEIDNISEQNFVIGYLGRYMPEKGFPVLIDAVRILVEEYKIKTIRVLSLGWGAFIREYQAYIREKGLADYFVFIEFQPDVRWILRQIHLLAVPSLREAFGLLAIEGLVSGTPIVASDCIGLREILKGTPARMPRAGDSRESAQRISEVIESYSTIKNEFIKFVPEALHRFDSNISATKLDGLIRELVTGVN